MGTLYDFLMEKKMGFMQGLVDRNRENPQGLHDTFSELDNPDLNKAKFGLAVQGAVRLEKQDIQPKSDMQPKSLVQRIQNIGKKTVMLGKNALKLSKKALGYKVQDEQPKDKQPGHSHEAWVILFCRDPTDLSGIEKAMKPPEWKEVKDPQTAEKYKDAGQMFYECGPCIMAFFYNRPASKYKATMIYRHPGPLSMDEYQGQLGSMLDWMIEELKPRQQAQPPRQMPELEIQESDMDYDDATIEENQQDTSYGEEDGDQAEGVMEIPDTRDDEVVIGENQLGTFYVRAVGDQAEGVMEIPNTGNMDQDTLNAYVIAMADKTYSAALINGGKLEITRKLEGKVSETEVMWTKMNLMGYAADFVKKVG